jgi:hypothetical protein
MPRKEAVLTAGRMEDTVKILFPIGIAANDEAF